MGAFMGMRGNGDWADNQRPENWREAILHEFPNGDAPITAITSMMQSESTDDPIFHWWTKRLPSQSGAVTSIYIDVGLGTEYVYATHQATHGIVGAVVYAKVALALAKEFRVGHQAVLRDDDRFDVDVVGKVVGVNYNAANSYIAIKLQEIDDNSGTSSSYNLATCDRIINCGDINPAGGAIPRAVAYDPVGYENYCGISRVPLEMTRTAQKTRLRTGDQVKEAKREALELYSIMNERKLIWSVRTAGTGANGKPEYTPDGILSFIRRSATTSYSASSTDASMNDFRLNTSYSGQKWLDGGEDWFDACLEYLGTYAPSEVTGYCGAGALTGITKLGKYTGNIQMDPGPNDAYGMKFSTWVNPHVTIHLKKHPLMARESSTKYSMLLLAPKNIKWRILDDTQFLENRGPRGVDASISEYLSEMGPEFHFPDQFMWLNGIGQANAV